MKVLIVEDQAGIALALQRSLQSSYQVRIAATGEEAMHEAYENQYAAMVLDLGLPDVSGLEVCRQVRQEGITTPILVLTAESEIKHKVELLDAGADDYLTKPFSIEELRARLRVLVRRGFKRSVSSQIVVGELRLDPITRQIERRGRPIQLRRKEFELLEYMMHHAGTVLSRQSMVDHIWDMGAAPWANSVDVHIKYLRDKIDRPFGEEAEPMIKTVHGVGYKLETSYTVAIDRREEVVSSA